MSKKAQKNQPEKKEIEIVDQQKDPMLRALQKKVRNMNKKLNQIAELSAKKDLKPEQEQKISKKEQVTQEKQKYLQMIEVYKQIVGESEKVIRKMQLSELQDLAIAIASKQYAVDLGFLFNQNVDNLVRVLTTPTSNDLTLRQRVDEIASALTDAANNTKLKKSLKQFINENPTKQRPAVQSVSNQEQPVSQQSGKQRQEQIRQLETEQKQKAQRVPEQPSTVTVPILIQGAPAPVTLQLKDTPQVSETPKNAVQQKQQNSVQAAPVTKTEQTQQVKQQANGATVEPAKNGDSPQLQQNESRQQKRGYRGYKGEGRGDGRGPRGNGKYNNEERKPYKKPTFKPKYEENKQTQQRDNDSSLEQSDDQPKARQFKRQEVRQLIQDGFIVVGKPKPKARDQKQYHDHQHGRKNQKRNY